MCCALTISVGLGLAMLVVNPAPAFESSGASPLASKPPLSDGDAALAASASNTFGVNLFRRVLAESSGRNVFISPLSMSTALSMAAEGARGETLTQMRSALAVPPTRLASQQPMDEMHQSMLALRSRLLAAAGDPSPEVRTKLTELERELAETNAKADELRNRQHFTESHKWSERAQAIASEINTLRTTIDRFKLSVANALWVDQAFPLVPAYVAKVDKHYGTGGVAPVSLRKNPEGARRTINTWVESRTNNRIVDLLPKGSIQADTALVITNAVYFKGDWAEPFEEKQTKSDGFLRPDQVPLPVKMMRDEYRTAPYAALEADGSVFHTPDRVPKDEAKWPATYPGDGGFTLLEIPYRGNELSMVIIVPRAIGGLASVESKLTSEALSAWIGALQSRPVDVAVPRFKLEFEAEMSGPLKAMGMQRAFVPPQNADGADFGGMSTSTALSEQLYIGQVRHKAFVEVAEQGTEAAAATAVMMAVGSAPRVEETVPFVPVFRADRPFLFVIRDRLTGVLLFMGRVSSIP